MKITRSELRKVRLEGSKPYGLLMLSLDGDLDTPDPVIAIPQHADVNDIDLRVFVGLHLVVVFREHNKDRAIDLVNNLLKIGVESLEFYNEEKNKSFCIAWAGEKYIRSVTPWGVKCKS